MASFVIDVFGKNEYTGEKGFLTTLNIETDLASVTITPEILAGHHSSLTPKNIESISMRVSCRSLMIRVFDIKNVSITSSAEYQSNFVRMLIQGCLSINLKNVAVRLLDIESINILIADCEIVELNIGREAAAQNRLSDAGVIYVCPLEIKIRNSEIKCARIYVPQKDVSVEGSYIENFSFESDCDKSEHVSISKKSTIDHMCLAGSIDEININDSYVAELDFSKGCVAKDLFVCESSIYNPCNCFPSTIVNKNADSLKIISESMRLGRKFNLQAQAVYLLMEHRRKHAKGTANKTSYFISKILCGYGYRPLNAIAAIFLVWAIYTFLFWGLILIDKKGTLAFEGLRVVGANKAFDQAVYHSSHNLSIILRSKLIPISVFSISLTYSEMVLAAILIPVLILSLHRRFGIFS
ncbi:MAG: hypothetical protein ABH872_00220 [Candidatus Omnitrophota bacterium]